MAFETQDLGGRVVRRVSRSTTQVVGDSTQYGLDCPDCRVDIPYSTIEAIIDPRTGKQKNKYFVRGVNGGKARCPNCDKPVIIIANRNAFEILRDKRPTFYTVNRRILSRKAKVRQIRSAQSLIEPPQ